MSVSIAQQDIHYSQYMFNTLAINPATAGNKPSINMVMFHKNQWTTLEQAPQFQTFSIHAPVSYKRMGIGLFSTHESVNGLSANSINGVYSYKIKLQNGFMSAGIHLGAIHTRVKSSDLRIKDTDDPTIVGTVNGWNPDMGIGLYYQQKKYYVGISAKHLIATSIKNIEYTIQPHYYLMSGYRVTVGRKMSLLPTAIIKSTKGAPLSFDVSTHIKHDDIGWIGTSYRNGQTISFQAGFPVNSLAKSLRQRIQVGYAYDMSLGKLASLAKQAHEVMLIVYFDMLEKPKNISNRKGIVSPVFF